MRRGELRTWAQAYGCSPHSLRRWERAVEEAPGPPPGRPPRPEHEREEARVLVRAAIDELGWSAGEGPVHHALGGAVPLRLVREVLAEEKRAHRRRRREVQASVRTSITVHARDALWAQDATHLGRDVRGDAVQAEVVREVASTRTLAAAVGPPARADDVISALEQARAERGTLPLVWATDNGSPYVSHELQRYLHDNKVVPLRSLPHTPQHNAWAEHGMRELKQEADLPGTCSAAHAQQELLQARDRLDLHRPRRSRGWRTAAQADATAPPATALVSRARFYTAAHCAIREAVLHSRSKTEHRRATREAVLQCMQHFGLITRTRAGVPLTTANSYRVS